MWTRSAQDISTVPKKDSDKKYWQAYCSSLDCKGERAYCRLLWMQQCLSLVPRPSHHPFFDRLQYEKTEGEGLVSFIT